MLLLLGKAFLTLDGIKRQLDPDFGAWLETLAYVSGGVCKRSRSDRKLVDTLRVTVHSALNTKAKIKASWQELWTFQPAVK
jgi:predicted unusual protein kinase regulating ubiquinone biosynthesis (AarF/ABC1/UbiB family)